MEIRGIPALETLDVRHPVLRTGRPRDTAILPEDNRPDTFHLGAYLDGRLVGVATYFARWQAAVAQAAGETRPGALYQLRGMAALPEYQGRGVGKALLQAGCARIRELGGRVLWCNARTGASAFYLSQGLAILGEEFEIALVGPHYVMWCRV